MYEKKLQQLDAGRLAKIAEDVTGDKVKTSEAEQFLDHDPEELLKFEIMLSLHEENATASGGFESGEVALTDGGGGRKQTLENAVNMAKEAKEKFDDMDEDNKQVVYYISVATLGFTAGAGGGLPVVALCAGLIAYLSGVRIQFNTD